MTWQASGPVCPNPALNMAFTYSAGQVLETTADHQTGTLWGEKLG
jgi:hypothetical protein